VSVIVLLLTSDASDPDSATATGVDWVKIAIGLLFLILAAKQWRNRPRKGSEPELPKWMSTIDSFAPGKALALGALLSGGNPKNLALTAAAAASIAQADMSVSDNAVAVAVFVLIGSLTVAGPVCFYVAAPGKATAPLASIKEFMADHNAVIMMVVLLVLGAKLLGQGLGAAA
jgi:threonine/homoserine/homoserine lactone efflux protein